MSVDEQLKVVDLDGGKPSIFEEARMTGECSRAQCGHRRGSRAGMKEIGIRFAVCEYSN
jgi:hypothetical protein